MGQQALVEPWLQIKGVRVIMKRPNLTVSLT